MRNHSKGKDRVRFVLEGFCVFAALTARMAAQSPEAAQYENKQIVEIQFSPARTLDTVDLEKTGVLKKGGPFHATDVANAIDALFATGRFEDVVVEAEPSGDGVLLRFVTKAAWFIGGISVEGKVAAPPNRGQIASTAQLNLGMPFRTEDLTNAIEAIRELLKANGLYEAELTPKVERERDTQQIFITLTIGEGKRAKYEKPVIQGDNRLSDATVLRATGWRIPIVHWWRQVTDRRTRKGVQDLLVKYQNQDRLTARVDLQKLDYDERRRRVRPSLSVKAGPKVKVKAVEAKVSQRVLKRYVPIFHERTVNNDLLTEGKRNLRDYFQSKGYYDVEVDFRSSPPQNDLQTIEYVISQGQRYKLVHVSITGNKYFRSDALRERMFLQPASFNLRHGRYSEAFRRKDEENITNLYRSNGFRDVKVISVVNRNYQDKAGQIAVAMKIEEGAQWLIDAVALDGITQFNRNELIAELAASPGQPFSEVDLASDRNQLLTYYYARGFPNANVKATWEPGNIPYHVNVIYRVTEGGRKYVRDVVTSGLRTTRSSLVNRNITLRAGDPLSPIEQTEIQKRFYDLGVFARVDTAIQNPDGDTDHKYILYNFEEAHRYSVGFGFGAQVARFGTPSSTSLTSPAGATGFSPEVSFDISRLNFLGMGQTVSLHGLYSSLEKRGSLNYLIPRFRNIDGQNITFAVLYDNSLNVRTFASRREEASVQVSEKFSKSMTGTFRFSYRRVSVSSVIIPVLLVPQLLQPVRLGMFSASFVQDRRDDPADPHRGIYNTADIGVAGKFFGAQRSFGRVLVRNATYHRLTHTVVLARQTQFGIITPFAAPKGLTEQQSVPLPERFFGGGADSLRAFPYNQAGPRDTGMSLVASGPASQPTGFPLGGNALFFNNVELRFPFLGANIQGVVFHDMGNVFSSLSSISLRFHQRNPRDFDYTTHAVGFGIRYRTPLGPIRLDLAYSVNPPSFIGFNGTPEQLLHCNPSSPPQGVCQGVRQNVSHFQFFFSIGQTF
jgi:outer membrane protein assembly complex protein YaeT